MKCNLVKESVTLQSDKSGEKSRTFNNYYLVFDNGYKLPVVVRVYDTEKAEGKKKLVLERVNFTNSQLMYALADTIEK